MQLGDQAGERGEAAPHRVAGFPVEVAVDTADGDVVELHPVAGEELLEPHHLLAAGHDAHEQRLEAGALGGVGQAEEVGVDAVELEQQHT